MISHLIICQCKVFCAPVGSSFNHTQQNWEKFNSELQVRLKSFNDLKMRSSDSGVLSHPRRRALLSTVRCNYIINRRTKFTFSQLVLSMTFEV